MFLREFLYVDVERVRGMLAQLDEGVVEGSTESNSHEKLTGGGLKGLAEHSQKWGGQRSVQKSQGDALFPTLEDTLDQLEVLKDLSEELRDPDFWTAEEGLRTVAPAGTLLRVTAEGSLFDARNIAATLTSFATTTQGLGNLGILPAPAPPRLKKGQQGGQVSRKASAEGSQGNLEDLIPNIEIKFEEGEDGVDPSLLRGIIQISRGLFAPGLHLTLHPTGADTHTISMRLQEGRQFMDSDADVLFSRYGGGNQQWTVVGTVGYHGEVVTQSQVDRMGITDSDDNVSRLGFSKYVNAFVGQLGTLGMVDTPRPPGFSVVPLAVYRGIGHFGGAEAQRT